MINRRYINMIVVFLAAVLVLPWGFIQPRALEDLRNLAFDTFQRQSPRIHRPDTLVKVIGVDEESLEAYGQWPWPRNLLARLTQILSDLGARVIVYDMIFAESDRLSVKSYVNSIADYRLRHQLVSLIDSAPDGDKLFTNAIRNAPVVLGSIVSSNGKSSSPPKAGFVVIGDDPSPFLMTFTSMILPFKDLYESSAGSGATNWVPDHDQIVRRVPLIFKATTNYVPSLALEALRIYQGANTYIVKSSNAHDQTAFGDITGINTVKIGNLEIHTGPNSDVRPRYAYSHKERILSAKSLLAGNVSRADIEGRIVIIGADAVGLGDVRATPLEPAVAGVEIQAQLVESLIYSEILFRPDWIVGLELVLSIFSFCVILGLLFYAPPFIAAMSGPLIVSVFIAASYLSYERLGILIDPVYPSIVVLGGYLIGSVSLWRAERLARDYVRHAFGKFLAPSVVDQIAENPEKLVLGSKTKELSILFCDLRDFSTLSRGFSAENLSEFMNDYFSPLTDAILEFEGTVDKYIGDALLAFWNAPVDIADHSRKAAKAALLMRQELVGFNKKRMLEEDKIAFGIGLHTGFCSVGNMGSAHRFDYTILGDAVNLTSRLEGACKSISIDILATEEFVSHVPDFAWLEVGLVNLVGRPEPVIVFALVGDELTANSDRFLNWHKNHKIMVELLFKRNFSEAIACAEMIHKTSDQSWKKFYSSFIERIEYFSNLSHNADMDIDLVWTNKYK